ncbi:MAG: efflux RND transporter periplasmic adaptor subunit [Alphaproteobacteria bacterium]|nr:efflux RND transporter periplasmic adaptor subunit [Alphaproteobacteria bacterium SS10]
MAKRLGIFVIVLAVVGFGIALISLREMPLVETATITTGQAIEAVYATGTVEPTIMLPISARRTARLLDLRVDEGAAVEAGQILAQLDDSDMRAVLSELRAQGELAQQAYDRQNSIRNSAAFNRANYDAALAELRATKAAIERAESDVAELKLTAPNDGQIIRRDGEVGEMINSGQAVFWFTCCAPLRISAEVDEEDIPQVTAGQQTLIRADAFPGQVFDGKVQSITPMGDATARSFRVRVELEPDTPLMIGMTVETNVVLREEPSAILAPRSAVIDGQVWVLDSDDRLQSVAVTTGTRSSSHVEILSGLQDGDEVVTNPSTDWSDGQAARRDWRLRNLARVPVSEWLGS